MSTIVMAVFLTSIGALVCYIIVEGIRIAWYVAISKRLANSSKKFERYNPHSTKRILFIGDSTGYGTGASHPRYSVVGMLGADFPDAHVENHSQNGLVLSKAGEILHAHARSKNKTMFDIVILMVGGMDLVRFMPLRVVRRTLRKVIAVSKQCGHHTIIISPNNTGLAPLYHFPLSFLYKKRARQFDALYRDVAREEHIRHVSLFQEHSDPLSARNLFALDKTHPNDEGYDVWYNQMKGTIATAMEHHD